VSLPGRVPSHANRMHYRCSHARELQHATHKGQPSSSEAAIPMYGTTLLSSRLARRRVR
jgi:hypothetical protein